MTKERRHKLNCGQVCIGTYIFWFCRTFKLRWTLVTIAVATMIFGLSAFLLYFFTAEAVSPLVAAQKGNPEELAEVAESMNLSTNATVGVLLKKFNDLGHALTSLHIIVDFFLVSSALIFLNVSPRY